ncbi:MAG: NAD-dependent dihydropyrimidine dehydrogenase subunit PreA [Phycisphaerales bacterium]
MADLRVTVDGLRLPNPFVIGSGPPGTNANVIARAFDDGWGAVIAKTISLDASKVINVAPRYARMRVPGTNEVWGWENIELISDRPFEVWLDEFRQVKAKYPDRVLVASIMEEYSKDRWMEMVQRCDATGVDAYELNFSCPHGLPERRMGSAMGQDPDILEEVCGWVKQATRRPVWAKMTPNITHIVDPARAALRGGATGISAINTILCVMGVNLDTLRPEPTVEGYTTPGGYSCKAVRPIALRMVMECAQMMRHEFPGRSLSAIGGVESGDDAAQFILLGANTVQVCTGVMIHGYGLVKALCDGLSAFMDRHGFANIDAFRGKSLEYFTTHADLVERQATAKQAAAAKLDAGRDGPQAKRDGQGTKRDGQDTKRDGMVRKDDHWSGDRFVEQSSKLVANE